MVPEIGLILCLTGNCGGITNGLCRMTPSRCVTMAAAANFESTWQSIRWKWIQFEPAATLWTVRVIPSSRRVAVIPCPRIAPPRSLSVRRVRDWMRNAMPMTSRRVATARYRRTAIPAPVYVLNARVWRKNVTFSTNRHVVQVQCQRIALRKN